MTTLAIQLAIHLVLLSGANGATCTKDSNCTGGVCDNPTQSDGGGVLTCCQPLGTLCFADSDCCTFGSAYVVCGPISGDEGVNRCGINTPTNPDGGEILCDSAADCIPESGSTYDESTQCLGTFYATFDAGLYEEIQHWLPVLDAGSVPGVGGAAGTPWVLSNSGCTACLQSSVIEAWYPGTNNQPCVSCCSGDCYQSANHENAVCCSDTGQVCVSDADCCPSDAGATISSCSLTQSCYAGLSDYCSDAGEVGTCVVITGQPCTTNDQCRSGFCGDGGICTGGC
jgi:hypothetical protein